MCDNVKTKLKANKMSIVYAVFYLENGSSKVMFSSDLNKALNDCECLRVRRKNGELISHVNMVSEDTNMIGQHGVDSIIDGKTPDGHEYSWKKRRN